ncbi:MAG: O-acetyl-ADP-ribose deacetylase (regulator of RNase III) [Chlamydiales bacterium]
MEKLKCPSGEAVITTAGEMRAKNVVHTVGPVWQGGQRGEAEILRRAYVNSLRLADQHGAKSIAFPSISTGVYAYPMEQAVLVAIEAIREFVQSNFNIKEVRFIVFSDHDFRFFEQALTEIKSNG